MMGSEYFVIIFSSLLLGFRHGVDWDHIAAITDLVGVETKAKKGMLLATMYSLGHGLVILVLGLSAIGLGKNIPSWLDSTMELLVASTLILLSIWMFITLIRQWNGFELRSKWSVALEGIRQLKYVVAAKVLKKEVVQVSSTKKTVGHAGAFLVGIIHGFGAETPTQILLLSTAAGMSTMILGGSVVFSFVVGLILSTSMIALLAVIGFLKARLRLSVYRVVGCLTAAYSLVLGVMILVRI
jgi:high-affinity nickel permease